MDFLKRSLSRGRILSANISLRAAAGQLFWVGDLKQGEGSSHASVIFAVNAAIFGSVFALDVDDSIFPQKVGEQYFVIEIGIFPSMPHEKFAWESKIILNRS